jgi:hypothetical protein
MNEATNLNQNQTNEPPLMDFDTLGRQLQLLNVDDKFKNTVIYLAQMYAQNQQAISNFSVLVSYFFHTYKLDYIEVPNEFIRSMTIEPKEITVDVKLNEEKTDVDRMIVEFKAPSKIITN